VRRCNKLVRLSICIVPRFSMGGGYEFDFAFSGVISRGDIQAVDHRRP